MAQELKNITFLIFISILILIYYLDVQTLPQPEEKNLVIFLVYGIGIFIAVEIIKSVSKGVKNKADNKSSFFQDIKSWIKSRQAILVLSIIIYVALIPYIGFFATSILFVIVLNFLLESRKLWELTILPVILLVFIYILFVVLLNINLPKGILF